MVKSHTDQAVLAKARAMYGKRITAQQYEEMLHCRSVGEVASFLKTQTHFADDLNSIVENNVHRGQLEHLLRRAAFESYGKLYQYLPNDSDSMYHYMVKEEEIQEILRMVQLLKADNAKSFIIDLPAYLIHRASVNLMSVAKATTFDELIFSLEGSDYAEILRRFQPSDTQPNIDYVGCEHAFYEYWYSKIFKTLSTYQGREKTELSDLMRIRVELLNIEHIFRSKVYLNTSQEDMIRSIYPYYYKVSSEQIHQMMLAKDRNAMQTLFSQTKYHRQFAEHDYPYIEGYTRRYFYQKCKSYLHFTNFASVGFYAYVTISQTEISNVINIIEGIRYQVSEDQIKELLII
jgi:V/A-type H+-transporting ATPase subunit C